MGVNQKHNRKNNTKEGVHVYQGVIKYTSNYKYVLHQSIGTSVGR